jgi:hypothetical protein
MQREHWLRRKNGNDRLLVRKVLEVAVGVSSGCPGIEFPRSCAIQNFRTDGAIHRFMTVEQPMTDSDN